MYFFILPILKMMPLRHAHFDALILIISGLIGTSRQLLLPQPKAVAFSSNEIISKLNSLEFTFFNVTYNSRLIYQLREQVNWLHGGRHSPVSQSCQTALRSLLNTPTENKWSLSMLDANAPLPSSLLSDEVTSVGGFEQCLAIDDVQDGVSIYGQYCLLELRLQMQPYPRMESQMDQLLAHLQTINKRFPLVLGLCLPSTCTAIEMNHLFEKYVDSRFGGSKFVTTKVEHCQSSGDLLGSHKSLIELLQKKNLVIAISVIATMTLLVLIGTLVDICSSTQTAKTKSTLSIRSTLISFSVMRNTAILFTGKCQTQKKESRNSARTLKTDTNEIEYRLAYLHGIRVLLIFWIIVTHSVSLIPASIAMPVAILARHPHDMVQLAASNGALSNFLANGTLAVEAFFLISGLLLVALTIAKNLQDKVSFLQFVLLRWIRFAPPLVGVILLWKAATLFGSGPFYAQSILDSSIQRSCQDNQWWKSLLFINNWSDLSDTCIPASWFLSADMQIHILAFVLIILIRKGFNLLFHLFCSWLILLNILLPLILLLIGFETFSHVDLFTKLDISSFVKSYITFYTGTHMHLGAYFLGAIIGFLIVKKPTLVVKNQFIWWASLLTVLLAPFISIPSSVNGCHLLKGLSIGSLHLLWALSFAIVLHILAQKTIISGALPVKRFLCLPFFRPLSRLSFSLYLCHMIPIWFNVFTVKTPFEVNANSIALFTIGTMIESIFLSYLVFLLFESPTVNLMKILFNLNKLVDTQDSVQVPKLEKGEPSKKGQIQLILENGCTAKNTVQPLNNYWVINMLKIAIPVGIKSVKE